MLLRPQPAVVLDLVVCAHGFVVGGLGFADLVFEDEAAHEGSMGMGGGAGAGAGFVEWRARGIREGVCSMGQGRVGTWGFGTWGVGWRGSEALGAEKGAAGGGAGEEGGKGVFVEGAGGADIVIEVRW